MLMLCIVDMVCNVMYGMMDVHCWTQPCSSLTVGFALFLECYVESSAIGAAKP